MFNVRLRWDTYKQDIALFRSDVGTSYEREHNGNVEYISFGFDLHQFSDEGGKTGFYLMKSLERTLAEEADETPICVEDLHPVNPGDYIDVVNMSLLEARLLRKFLNDPRVVNILEKEPEPHVVPVSLKELVAQ